MKDNDMEKTDIQQPQAPESELKDTSGVMMEGHIPYLILNQVKSTSIKEMLYTMRI